MKRLGSRTAPTPWLLWATSVVAVVTAALAVVAQEAKPAIPADAKYVTSKVCGMCHKDIAKLWSQTLHAKQQPAADCPDPWRYATGWNVETKAASENGAACEACHGRGGAHVKASAETRKQFIIKGSALETPALEVSICAQCHAQYTVAGGQPPVASTPGEDLLAKVQLAPAADGGKMQQVNELVGSKHFAKGTVCLTCHSAHTDSGVAHQLKKAVPDLCLDCHKDKADMAAHTKGKAKAGDTCVTCHMPGGSHAFKEPASQ